MIVEDDWIFAEIGEKVPDVALLEAHLLFCILPPRQVNIMFHNIVTSSNFLASPNEFEIVSNYPKRRLACKPTDEPISLAEAGFSKSEMLFVNDLES